MYSKEVPSTPVTQTSTLFRERKLTIVCCSSGTVLDSTVYVIYVYLVLLLRLSVYSLYYAENKLFSALTGVNPRKAEKLRCLINYFSRVTSKSE